MYMIENFGGWILDTRRGFLFGVAVVLLSGWVVWKMFVGSVVILSEKDYECTLPAPDGLGTKCVEYHAKRGK